MTLPLRNRVVLLCAPPLLLLVAASGALLVHMRTLSAVLLVLGLVASVYAAVCALLAARSLERFIAAMLTAFHSADKTGELRSWSETHSTLQELQELAEGYQHAAAAVRAVQERRRQAYVQSVGSLALALDARDPSTAGHSRRVSDSACAVGRAMGLPAQQMERLRVGAVLHDIGKIAVTDAILQKEGPLTDDEMTIVQRHPRVGRDILESVQGFNDYLDAVEQHHENWDGTGYPKGLRGEAITVEARIIHVADAYDAMTTNRCYRKGMSHEVAIRILWSCSGTQFDPTVVSLFAALPEDMLEHMRAVVAGEPMGEA